MGAWTSFWIESQNSILNNDNQTSLPDIEIDIFEWYGCQYTGLGNSVQECTHNWQPSGGPAGLYSPSTPMPGGAYPWQGYHIYGCQVDPAFITFFIDGVQTNQIATPTGYATSPFYMMVDYAIGGGWPMYGIVNNSGMNVDWVRVYSLPFLTSVINDNTTGAGLNQFNYSSNWSYSSQPGAYQSDNHYTNTANANVTFQFNGTQVQWYACKAPNCGIVAVSIDGGPETNVDQYAASRVDKAFLWSSPVLTSGTHTFKARCTGTQNPSASADYITADRIDIIGSPQ